MTVYHLACFIMGFCIVYSYPLHELSLADDKGEYLDPDVLYEGELFL